MGESPLNHPFTKVKVYSTGNATNWGSVKDGGNTGGEGEGEGEGGIALLECSLRGANSPLPIS